MAAFSDFYGWILPQVGGALNIVVDRAIIFSCRKFCDQTHSWRADLTISPVTGVRDYVLPVPAGAEVIRVRTAVQGGMIISPTTDDTLAISTPNYINQTASTASFYTVPTTGTFRLHPMPVGASINPVAIAVAMRPTIAATVIPQFLFDEWLAVIADGALAYLKAQIDQPWGDGNQAAYHEGRFNQSVNDVRVRLNSGDASYNRAIQVRPFL